MSTTIRCGNPECRRTFDCPDESRGQEVECPHCGARTSASQPADLPLSSRLGNYTIVRKLGEGAMGAVYEAIQGGLNRKVALKVLSPELTKDEAYLRRFEREAQSAATLAHPNIVTIYENGQDQGHCFISLEFVDGESLGARLQREGKLEASEALTIAMQVAAALD